MEKQSWKITPQSALGWWSIGFIVATPILFVIGSSFQNLLYKSVPAGGTILADIAARPALALTMLAGMLSGVFAFVTGLIDIIQNKGKIVLVYVSTTIGALFIVYLIAELLP
jgi:hypothetical protein